MPTTNEDTVGGSVRGGRPQGPPQSLTGLRLGELLLPMINKDKVSKRDGRREVFSAVVVVDTGRRRGRLSVSPALDAEGAVLPRARVEPVAQVIVDAPPRLGHVGGLGLGRSRRTESVLGLVPTLCPGLRHGRPPPTPPFLLHPAVPAGDMIFPRELLGGLQTLSVSTRTPAGTVKTLHVSS